MSINWFKYSSPQTFFPLAGKLAAVFGALALVACAAGLYLGFFVAPTDAQQGESYRIIFIHVPAAWMSMFLYVVMAFWAAIGLAFNTRLSGMMASAIAPTGALFTFIALWTGSFWGKPAWGTWWVWDARLTSELILLFLYFGFMALQAAIDDPRRADKAGALIAHRRRDQRADHLLLGAMVEHAAPGRLGQPHQVPDHGRDHARGHAHHDLRLLVLRHRGGAAARALHHARARARERLGRTIRARRRMTWGSLDNFLAMGGYGLYVWGSYAVTLALIFAELLVLARRWRSAVGRIR